MLWEKEKLHFLSHFSFFYRVFKRLVLSRHVKTQVCFHPGTIQKQSTVYNIQSGLSDLQHFIKNYICLTKRIPSQFSDPCSYPDELWVLTILIVIWKLKKYTSHVNLSTQSQPITTPQKNTSENIVGKGENAGYQLFPQCFLPFPELISIFQSHLFWLLQKLTIWNSLKFCHLVKT